MTMMRLGQINPLMTAAQQSIHQYNQPTHLVVSSVLLGVSGRALLHLHESLLRARRPQYLVDDTM